MKNSHIDQHMIPSLVNRYCTWAYSFEHVRTSFVQVLLGDWIVFDCRPWKGTLRLKGFLQPSMVARLPSRVYVEKKPPNRPRWRGVKKCPLMSTFLPVGHLGHREPVNIQLPKWSFECGRQEKKTQSHVIAINVCSL